MSFKSKVEYPAPRLSSEILLDKIEQYRAKGLTMKEASDMATFDQIEFRGGELSAVEQRRKEAH